MVIVNVMGVPEQVPDVGVTVIVPEIGVEPVFVPTKEGISPVPFAPNPIDVLEFVQLYVVAVPVKLIAVVEAPVQIV